MCRRLTTKGVLVGLFAVSRLIVYPRKPFWYTLDHYMQYLDPQILRDDLLRGLFNLHTQPPLVNMFLGAILKLVPEDHLGQVFPCLYFLLGIGILCVLLDVLIRFGVTERAAAAACVVTMLLPSMTNAERWLFYAYPLAFLVLLTANLLQKWAQSPRYPLWPFLLGSSAVVLSRSAFHLLLWLAPIYLLLALLSFRQGKKATVLGIVAAFFVSGLPYGLNLARYGVFSASTWQGMNLAMMTAYISDQEIERMIAQGRVTPLARIPRFSPPEVYLDYYKTAPATGLAMLDQTRKSTGAVNWNHAIYPRTSREYQRNALTLIRTHPAAYLKAVLNELYLFFGLVPYLYFSNFDAWFNFSSAPSLLALGKSVFRLIVFPIGAALSFVLAVVEFARRATHPLRSGLRAASVRGVACELYIIWTLLYVLGVSVFFELGEGCYFRMPIDPLIVIGVALSVHRCLIRLGPSADGRPGCPVHLEAVGPSRP
jgi:hypothetical protein